MAIIGKIRKRSGLLIILIGVAIAGFVLQDAFKGTRGFRNIDFAEVDGEKISYRDFDKKVEEQLEQIKAQQQKDNLTSQEVYQVRQSVWNQMVNDILMGKEYEKLSIEVTTEEMNDMFYGKFLHSFITQNFKNPNTGQVERQNVINYINNFDQLQPEQQKQWKAIEDYIKADRLRTKYNNLLTKSYYLPKAFLKKTYHAQNDKMKLRFVALDYSLVSDSVAKITDKDYQAYYDEHKNEFEQEASRDIDYVMFEIQPSKEDIDNEVKRCENIFEEFKTATNIADFVNSYSDSKYDSSFKKKGTLPYFIDSMMFNSPVGAMYPPRMENGVIQMAKLVDVQMRPDSMKASHILFAYQGAYGARDAKRTKEEAQKIADSVKLVVQKDPAKFAEIALSMSDDPSAKENKGDLGWFIDQSMVAPFNDAVLKGKVGDYVVVESIFGYHLINITGKKAPEKKVRVALITRKIEASNQTYKNVFAKANKFASENTTLEQFEATIKKEGLVKRTAEYVQPMADYIPGVQNARELVRWAFNKDTKKNDVSKQVFEFENMFIVAVLKEVREKGIAPLEQIKPRIEFMVKRDKKAAILIEKANKSINQNKDIYSLASMLNSKVDTVDLLNYSSFNLGNRGYEPEVIGTAFAMKLNTLSKPIKGYSGVYIIHTDEFEKAPETNDYSLILMQQRNNFEQRVNSNLFRAIQDKAEIIDNRIMFY
jgi:peptidyl-prolyl cis-trans isomerase D